MKTPNSTLELSEAIESLVASYMESVREAAKQAVARALVIRGASRRRSSPATRTTSATSQSTPARRTSTELEQVCDALCERVRAQPGASMVELAEQMGADAGRLRRPMTKLRAAGRVRSVGERHLTRYYPAVVRTVPGNGA
jgi:hypothetical protein